MIRPYDDQLLDNFGDVQPEQLNLRGFVYNVNSEHPPSLSFAARSDLVVMLKELDLLGGTVVYAEGYAYIAQPGATAIADMPGYLPYGDVHVEHFNAKCDMTWDTRTLGQFTGSSGIPDATTGPWRIRGTNDLAAFQAANAYATARGGVFYAERGDAEAETGYFVDGQLELTSRLVSRTNYRACMWLRNSNVYHSCIWIKGSGGGVVGLSLIGQYAYVPALAGGTDKPASHGQMGPTITVCAGESPFGGPTIYTTGAQEILEGVEVDVMCCRAGLDMINTPSFQQRSASTYHLFSAAGVEGASYRVGVFGTTNIASNGMVICHWGLRYSGGDPYTDWGSMEIEETYHTCDSTIEIMGHVDQVANKHGFLNVLELSSAGHITVGDISCRGVTPIVIQPGDAINEWSNARQKQKVMRGIRVGNVFATDVLDSRVDAEPVSPGPPARASGFAVMVRGYGTVQTDVDHYPGTSIMTSRQLEVDVAFKSITVARPEGNDAWASRGVYVAGCWGRVDLGAVMTWGYGRAVDIQYCNGDTRVDYVGGDGSVLYIHSRGGSILGTATNKGTSVGDFATNGAFGPGYAGANRCVYLTGRSLTTTTTANAALGATQTKIIGIADEDIYIGTPVKIGNYWVTVTENIQALVPFIRHSPLPAAVLSGATVTVNDRGGLVKLIVSSASGEDAVYATGGVTVDFCDMSRLQWSGKTGLNLLNATVNVYNDLPTTVGRYSPIADNYTIVGDYLSHVVVQGGTISTNPQVTKHFQFGAGGGGNGTVLLTKCRVEDTATLVGGSLGSQVNVLQMRDCIGLDSAHAWHPTKSGLITVTGTPPAVTGGYYQYHEDGVLECWLRNQVSSSDGALTWSFPVSFGGGASSVCVTANSTGATPYIIACGAPTSTDVAIQAYDPAGAVAGEAVSMNVHAIGRWTT